MHRWLLIPALLVISGCDTPTYTGGGANTNPTSASSHKALVRGYMEELINHESWDSWEKYFPDQVGFNDRPVDRLAFQRMVASFKSAYPDFRMVVQQQIAEGDRVVTRVHCEGTHLGNDEGVAATGKRVRFTGIAIDRIQDGKVVEMWYWADTWDRLKQIGRP